MQTIYLDISNKGVVPTVYAKQGDVGRKFQVVLTDSGVPYVPASGSAFSVWYSGASGEGNYTDIGDKSAFSVNGNKVIVEMITQMLSNEGEGVLSLILNDINGNQIGMWNIRYVCESVPGVNSEEAKEYYSAFSESVKKLSDTDAILRNKLSVDGTNTMEANLPMGGHRVTGLGEPAADGDAVNLGALNTAVKKAAPHNLLDNSDFRNPVNQKGQTEYIGSEIYTIDRWLACHTGGNLHVSTLDGYIKVWAENYDGLITFSQRINKGVLDANKRYTFAYMRTSGNITIEYDAVTFSEPTFDYVQFELTPNQTLNLVWAALYEGEYTAETLPEYQPKGYGAELAECRRHYRKVNIRTFGIGYTKTKFAVHMLLDTPMRVKPTVTVESCKFYNTNSWTYDEIASYLSGNPATGTDFVSLYFVLPNDTFVENTAYNIQPLTITLDAGL